MTYGWLGSAVAQVVAPVSEAVRALSGAPSGRRCATTGTRTHMEARGLHRPENAPAREAVEDRLGRLEGVQAVEVNAAIGRVVVTHEPDVSARELADELALVEDEHGIAGAEVAPASAHHPGDPSTPLNEVAVLASGVAGLGYATATSFLPVRTLTPLVPAVLSLTGSVPWMRETLRGRLGEQPADTLLEAGGVLSHTLAGKPLSLITSACQNACTSGEALARRQAWLRWDRDTAERPGSHRAGPLEVGRRPCPLPPGPVEHVANASGAVALGGYAAVIAVTGSPQHALATLTAGTPRAGHAGREAFAAALGATISGRGALVFAPTALRRLDRVDAVVVDGAVMPLPGADDLLRTADAVGEVVVSSTTGREPGPLVGRLAVGTLSEAVRELQEAGRAVAAVSDSDGDGLAAADVGIGVPRPSSSGEALPWGGSVLCPDLASAAAVLAAAGEARLASARSAALAVTGSGIGAAAAWLGPSLGAASRASVPVHAAALSAIGLGAWAGVRAADKRVVSGNSSRDDARDRSA